MLSTVSLPDHTFTGQTWSSKRLTSIVHILLPETDNCPSWISERERMTLHHWILPADSTSSLKPYQQLLLHQWSLTSSFYYITEAYKQFLLHHWSLQAASTTSLKRYQQLLTYHWSLWMCWCLMTHQPLWVILCHLPEKGRQETEEIVEEIIKRNSEERGKWMKVKKQKNYRHPSSIITCY